MAASGIEARKQGIYFRAGPDKEVLLSNLRPYCARWQQYMGNRYPDAVWPPWDKFIRGGGQKHFSLYGYGTSIQNFLSGKQGHVYMDGNKQ